MVVGAIVVAKALVFQDEASKFVFVLEVVENYRSDTYRAVCTVKFSGWIYVLHCFQKKSKSGIKTPKEDVALITARLKAAKQDYECWQRRHGA